MTVTAIVEREFGAPPDAVERVDTGLLHDTYEVGLDGERYVLQFAADTDDRRDSLHRTLGCYRLLAGTSVPVPGVVTDAVRSFEGREYTIVERVPGDTIEESPTPERARRAGQVLARLHGVGDFEEPGWLRFERGEPTVAPFDQGGWRGWVRQELVDTLRTLRDLDLGSLADDVDGLFAARGDALPADVEPVLCHGDCSPDNLAFEGGTLTGVLDFDRAYAGHAARDLARAANAFWMHDPTADWDVRAAVYQGYRGVHELAVPFERTEPLYRVALLAGTVTGMAELGELSPYEREFYAEALEVAVERALEGE